MYGRLLYKNSGDPRAGLSYRGRGSIGKSLCRFPPFPKPRPERPLFRRYGVSIRGTLLYIPMNFRTPYTRNTGQSNAFTNPITPEDNHRMMSDTADSYK